MPGYKLNLDSQLYRIDMFTTSSQILDKYDFPALFDFLSSNLTTQKIKRTLLIAGSLQITFNLLPVVER